MSRIVQEKSSSQAAESFNQWETINFDGDDGGARRSKFLKMMGVKGEVPVVGSEQEGGAGEGGAPVHRSAHAPQPDALSGVFSSFYSMVVTVSLSVVCIWPGCILLDSTHFAI